MRLSVFEYTEIIVCLLLAISALTSASDSHHADVRAGRFIIQPKMLTSNTKIAPNKGRVLTQEYSGRNESGHSSSLDSEEISDAEHVPTPWIFGPTFRRAISKPKKILGMDSFITSEEESLKKLAPYYLPDERVEGISSQCLSDVKFMKKLIMPRGARLMIDSWGKTDDGMRFGLYSVNYHFPGVMDECLNVFVNETDAVFDGQYCMVNANFQILPQKYGTCIPSSCSARDLQESVRQVFRDEKWFNPDLPEPTVHCQMHQFEGVWGTWELVSSGIIEALVVVVIVATVIDLLAPDTISSVLKTFSASENCAKIFAVTRGNPGEISCFYGIRVMSMLWVILGHQFVTMLQQVSNSKHIFQLTERWPFQIISSAVRAVDTFFFLGGILLTRGLLKTDFCVSYLQSEKKSEGSDSVEVMSEPRISDEVHLREKLNNQGFIKTAIIFFPRYASYIFHRVLRVWPGMFITIMFFAGPASLLLSGPLKAAYESYYLPVCRESWWWDLTFFTNFLAKYAYYHKIGKASCLGNSWYLSMDMQMYLVMPFLILPVKVMKRKQLFVWGLIAVSCIIPMAIIMALDLPPTTLLSMGMNSEAAAGYSYQVYFMPYARATPYFVGALCALWLVELERSGKSGKELLNVLYEKHPRLASLHPRVVGWLVVTAVGLAVVLGLAESNYSTTFSPATAPEPHTLTKAETFFYATFAILAWSLVCAWVVMMCALGLADPLNFFLSHPMWQPLSRLTFGSYLISLPLQALLYATLQEFIYFSYNTAFILWTAIVALSFFGSFLLSLLAEAPIINLLKLMRQK